MKRREFVQMAAVGLAGSGTVGRWDSGTASLLPRLAAGTLGAIGIQLYTVRRELTKDVEGTLARVAEIGFREVEFAGFPNTTAKSLRTILDRLHLTAPAAHVPFQAIRSEWERTLEDAATLGQHYIVVASLPANERATSDGWKRVAAQFSKAGEVSKRMGLQFCYHNHDFEFAPLDGAPAYDLLLAGSDPTLVQMELDLYWVTKGGADPLAYFAKWPGRFPLVHVKDMDNTPKKYFADVGSGTIDFKPIFRKAGQAGIKHYFYEQDETPGPVFDSARASYEFLRRLMY